MTKLINNIEKRFENVSKSKTFKNIVDVFDLGNKKVLDLGCSYGEFLIHLGHGSIGITITKEEVDYGKSKGLDVRYGNIESDDFVLEQEFDVIFANNIFEHLNSPHLFLCKIKKYLKQDGLLILGVPCIPKIVSLLHLNKFRGSLASSHINFFTSETLVLTVERAGWNAEMKRGFHFSHVLVDHMFDVVYPHFYVIASNKTNFNDSEKSRERVDWLQ